MNHSQSRTLFSYWENLRGSRPAPDRADVEPRAIAALLGDTFILERDATGTLPYRLAGSRICAIFGREMKGASFLGHLRPDDLALVRRAIANVMEAPSGVLLSLTGTAATGRTMALEALVLPLTHRGRLGSRLIGCLTTDEPPYWMGRDGIERLTLDRLKLVWPGDRAMTLVPSHPARIQQPLARPAAARPMLRLIRGGTAA